MPVHHVIKQREKYVIGFLRDNFTLHLDEFSPHDKNLASFLIKNYETKGDLLEVTPKQMRCARKYKDRIHVYEQPSYQEKKMRELEIEKVRELEIESMGIPQPTLFEETPKRKTSIRIDGDKVRQRREASGLTDEQLTAIWDYYGITNIAKKPKCTEKIGVTYCKTVIVWAAFFDIPILELLEDDEENIENFERMRVSAEKALAVSLFEELKINTLTTGFNIAASGALSEEELGEQIGVTRDWGGEKDKWLLLSDFADWAGTPESLWKTLLKEIPAAWDEVILSKDEIQAYVTVYGPPATYQAHEGITLITLQAIIDMLAIRRKSMREKVLGKAEAAETQKVSKGKEVTSLKLDRFREMFFEMLNNPEDLAKVKAMLSDKEEGEEVGVTH